MATEKTAKLKRVTFLTREKIYFKNAIKRA